MTKEDIKIIGAYFDDERAPEICEQVESWLTADPENVAKFVDHMIMHNDLGRLVLAEDLQRFVREEHADREIPSMESTTSCDLDDAASERVPKPFWLIGTRSMFAMAASLLLIALFTTFNSNRDAEREDIVADSSPKQPDTSVVSTFVATVSDTDSCCWEDEAHTLLHGQYLELGTEVSITEGLAQLTFETGAVVILEGPCRLAVADNAIDLSFGKISASVPQAATGFSVETPNSQVVDLGTEFGINVDQHGDTEIHVFRGEVVSRRVDEAGQPAGEFFRLTADRGIAFRRGSKLAEQLEANEAAFTRRLRRIEQRQFPQAAPVEGELLLWLAADHGVLSDESGGVFAWLDTLTDKSNNVADNALQPVEGARPQLVEDAIGGLPALRFDGRDDCLTTTPMANDHSQTIAFVAAFDPRSNRKGNLINYNGPPQVAGAGDLSLAVKEKLSILQIRACRLRDAKFPVIDPYVYAGHWKGSSLFVGRMEHTIPCCFGQTRRARLQRSLRGGLCLR